MGSNIAGGLGCPVARSATLHSAANRRDSFMNAYITKTRFEIPEISRLSDNIKCNALCTDYSAACGDGEILMFVESYRNKTIYLIFLFKRTFKCMCKNTRYEMDELQKNINKKSNQINNYENNEMKEKKKKNQTK